MNENELSALIMGFVTGAVGISLVWGAILYRIVAPLLPKASES